MEDEYPVNLRVEMAPDDSALLLPGSITITRTTVSVFKLCEMNDEEPLFIGVCSVPLLRFVRRRSSVFPASDALIIMGVSEHLFINASLSAGITQSNNNSNNNITNILQTNERTSATSRATNSTGIFARTPKDDTQASDNLQRLDNPALWRLLRLEFPTAEGCDRCVEALLARNAQDITNNNDNNKEDSLQQKQQSQRGKSPSTTTGGGRQSRDGALYPDDASPRTRSMRASESMTSVPSYNHHNNHSSSNINNNNNNNSNKENNNTSVNRRLQEYTSEMSEPMHSCRSPLEGSTSNYQIKNSPIPAIHQAVNRNLNRPLGSQREIKTPHESRDGRNTPRDSQHGRGLPTRSNPTNSKRELDTPSDIRTPRSSRQGILKATPYESQKEILTPHESRDGRNTPRDSQHGRGLPTRSNPTNSKREYDTPTEVHTPRSSRQGILKATPYESQKEILTPHESRDGRNTPRDSQHGRGLPTRSNPTNSKRELDTPSDIRTPRSIHQSRNDEGQPSSRQRDGCNTPRDSQHGPAARTRSNPTNSQRDINTPSDVHTPRNIQQAPINGGSQRDVLTPRESRDGRYTPIESHHSRGLPSRSNPADSRRELDTPSEIRTPRDNTRDIPRNPRVGNNPLGETNTRDLPTSSTPHSLHNGYGHKNVVDPIVPNQYSLLSKTDPKSTIPASLTNQIVQPISLPYGYNIPTSQTPSRTSRSRTEQQYFLRNVMKLMHHRLHFMQYLHKELVHEAYLAEEVKLFGGRGRNSHSASVSRRSASRPASLSPRSPRRTAHSSIAEESSRLREIEERLRVVEELHREAEIDRREAAQLRNEVEQKLKSAVAREAAAAAAIANANANAKANNIASSPSSAPHRAPPPPSHDVSELNEYVNSLHNYNIRGTGTGSKHHSSSYRKNESSDMARASNNSKPHESELSAASRHSTLLTGSGQIVIAPQQQQQQQQQLMPIQLPTPDTLSEADYSTAILDRYIYGDEWSLLYPGRESEVRFNALIDICLTMKIPRHLISITNISVDQPGLRLTAEIRYDHDSISREVLERRFSNQPFRFLQRLYELRYCFANSDDVGASTTFRSVHRGSRVTTPRLNHRASASYLRGADGDIVMLESEEDMGGDSITDTENKLRELQRRADERGRQREQELTRDRERKLSFLHQERLHQQLEKLEEEESFRRSRIVLSEAQERQNLTFDKDLNHRHNVAMARHALEEKENIARAMVEVGYARQTQALAQAQRRNLTFVRLATQESERRQRLNTQEEEERTILNIVMNPQRMRAGATQPEISERTRRQRLIEAEAKQRAHIYTNIQSFLIDALQQEMEGVISDETAARIVLAADEMKERIDVVCASSNLTGEGKSRSLSIADIPMITTQTWQALLAEEITGREQIINDELRRRRLFQREYIITTEDVIRNEIELKELDEHVALLDTIVQRNRAMLERRRQERENIVKLTNEEQYYRKGIVSDEQDGWEMFMELFDSELNDLLLAEAARLTPAPELESPQRRRRAAGTPRQTKAFHYMTFAAEDMDHPPTAALAIEGILGCSINKNLEVTSIARPLPKVEEAELQFQAGDMILDVAGYSLHSLSHLREVLGSRALQIQHEAREEFSSLAEEELTINPALQKYVDVLCEHHNFLVQVLRGCDIFQIIVKS